MQSVFPSNVSTHSFLDLVIYFNPFDSFIFTFIAGYIFEIKIESSEFVLRLQKKNFFNNLYLIFTWNAIFFQKETQNTLKIEIKKKIIF